MNRAHENVRSYVMAIENVFHLLADEKDRWQSVFKAGAPTEDETSDVAYRLAAIRDFQRHLMNARATELIRTAGD